MRGKGNEPGTPDEVGGEEGDVDDVGRGDEADGHTDVDGEAEPGLWPVCDTLEPWVQPGPALQY